MRKTDEVGHVSLISKLSLVIILHMTFDLSAFLSGGSKVVYMQNHCAVGGRAW